ncbi:MAG: H-NS histone family protein [Thiolinea sp.]
MTDLNLHGLSVQELENLKNGIDGMIEHKRVSELLALRDKVDELVDDSPFTLEEVLEARKFRKPVPPKYRSPDDPSLTWTGRGRQPKWVEAYVNGGGDLDAIRVDH